MVSSLSWCLSLLLMLEDIRVNFQYLYKAAIQMATSEKMWFHFLSKTLCKFHLDSGETLRFTSHFAWNAVCNVLKAQQKKSSGCQNCSLRLNQPLIEVRKVLLSSMVKLRLNYLVGQGVPMILEIDRQLWKEDYVSRKKQWQMFLIKKNVKHKPSAKLLGLRKLLAFLVNKLEALLLFKNRAMGELIFREVFYL